MTKEEYERLLKSDYWKGYSYSLIKERNFTCHDCGRRFPGERNKLQVHHLHYRDVNPWSYGPEEVVVLCEECHMKRHGILPPGHYVPPVPEYKKHIETSAYNRDFLSSYSTSEYDVSDVNIPHTGRLYEAVEQEWNWRKWRKPLLAVLMLLVFVATGLTLKQNKAKRQIMVPTSAYGPVEIVKPATTPSKSVAKPATTKKVEQAPVKREPMEMLEHLEVLVPADLQGLATELHVSEPEALSVDVEPAVEQIYEKTSLEILDERIHANTVKRAQEVGVSTEGSTLDIMDRINHENTVRRAKEVGVSTEGSTLDIMDRINHVNTVRRAKEIGVSTEGSTLDIMDRINHANTVKRAQELGVSTEGTTLEIMERINRKHLESR